MTDEELIAIIAAILLSGRGYVTNATDRSLEQRLEMLQDEKNIAIFEAADIVKMARWACGSLRAK